MPCNRLSPGGGYPNMPCRFPGPHLRGKFRGICSGGSPIPHLRGKLRGSGPGPQPRGKLRGIQSWTTTKGEVEGIRSRPTAKGEVEGDPVQDHNQGGTWGGSGRGGACSRGVETPPADGYCCGRYASYWNAFLFLFIFTLNFCVCRSQLRLRLGWRYCYVLRKLGWRRWTSSGKNISKRSQLHVSISVKITTFVYVFKLSKPFILPIAAITKELRWNEISDWRMEPTHLQNKVTLHLPVRPRFERLSFLTIIT